ncbi:hypothetical protein [Achromobacter spanius]|uniref:Tyr recombinase domain-containing protein n=1 Tax=Achromobacter spanius TaxID=217203 RepID=A0AAW3I2Q7_9BURK|nr:hypothetical protein [Achromobacter spanius]KNE27043.1 hypothetical protein AFM18_14290 [Achromobacter spanius]
MDTTYLQLIGVHEHNLTFIRGPISDQVLRNHKAALNSYLAFCNRTVESRIGREFTVEFARQSRAYGAFIATDNRKSAADKLSILRAWKRTVDKHVRETMLKTMAGHSTFHKELRLAIAASGQCLKEIAKAIYTEVKTLNSWCEGVTPIYAAIPALRRLEKHLNLEQGFLERKIVFPTKNGKVPTVASADKYEIRLRETRKDSYYVLPADFSQSLLDEWTVFVHYKTCQHPIGLKRGSRAAWRSLPIEKAGIHVKKQPLAHPAPGLVCSSAHKNLQLLQGFLGFLTKARGSGRATSGLGLQLEKVDSLAVFAIPEFVDSYLEFVKARSGDIVHNGHSNAAGVICGMCREIEGYLWQQPEIFASRVEQFSKGRSWLELCAQTVEVCRSWQRKAAGKKSRDPKAILQPLFAMSDMLHPFKEAIMKLDLAAAAASPGSVHQATYKRDALILGLCLFNPLRHRTLTITKYIEPKKASQSTSNLYQADDGQWWLRFEKGDFKNDESKDEDYSSPITRDLSHRIEQYLEVFRPILVRNNTEAIYLFPNRHGDQINDIGEVIARLARNFIPEVRRLRVHALRHIVATDFLRRNPGKYTLLAGLLHDTLATVLKTYAHGKTESAFRAHEENMKGFYEGI